MVLMKSVKVAFLALVIVAAVGLGQALAADADQYKGTLVNVTGSESGGVILNYVRASDTWVVNVSADGLQPGVSYEVIFNVPGIISIGCFIANAGGHGHLNVSNIVLPYASFIFPPAGPESRINVRLDDPITAGCNGILGTGVLTTLTGFGGSGLIATGSNRGH